ncbi:MAG: AI-2E family transporter [Ktedonobacteraceae bacterium]|nr:AI-2E family transporter [Ktedonobacteraceae bacterium]
MNRIHWHKWRDILITIICIGIILWVAWGFVNQFIETVLLFLLSMTIAFLISPIVDFLERRHIPRILSAILIYIVSIVLLAGFFYALTSSLVKQAITFSDTVVNFVWSIPNNFSAFINFLRQQGIPENNIRDAYNQIQYQVTSFASSATAGVLNIVLFVINTFLDFIIILVISFYLTIDGKRIRDSIFNVVPQRSRPYVLLFEDALNRVVGNYIRGQLTLALLIGVLVALVCLITGLGQFALIFGVLGFLFETIPMVGPGLASISPIIASLLLPNPFPRTLIVLACFVVIQVIESNILGPRIVGHAVGLHPVASILALLVFARLFGSVYGAFGGAAGALVATPIVAAIWVVIASFYRSMHGETAEQMLAKKRAPWTFKRPSLSTSFRFKRTRKLGSEEEQIAADDTAAREEEALLPPDVRQDNPKKPV